MAKSVMKCIVLMIVGAVLGATVPIIAGIGRGLVEGLVAVVKYGNSIKSLPSGIFIGALMMLWDGGDWSLFVGFVGALIAFLGFLWSNIFKKSPPMIAKRFLRVAICVVCIISSAFVFQKYRNTKSIDSRYVELCSALHKRDYEAAYTYLTPEYRQGATLDEFVQLVTSKSFFWGPCPPHPRRYVAISGNRANLYPDRMSFVSLYSGARLELEKIDGEWYFTDRTAWLLD